MRSCNSYQEIRTPEELEDEETFDSIYQSLLNEYDYEQGSYSAYKDWCRRRARQIVKEQHGQEEDNDI